MFRHIVFILLLTAPAYIDTTPVAAVLGQVCFQGSVTTLQTRYFRDSHIRCMYHVCEYTNSTFATSTKKCCPYGTSVASDWVYDISSNNAPCEVLDTPFDKWCGTNRTVAINCDGGTVEPSNTYKWGEYGSCTFASTANDCLSGKKTRSPVLCQQGEAGCNLTPGQLPETIDCSDCYYYDSTSACSVTCGAGTRQVQLTRSQTAGHNGECPSGNSCFRFSSSLPAVTSIPCSLSAQCPMKWGAWSACQATCDVSFTQTRSMIGCALNEPGCSTNLGGSNVQTCFASCRWGDWSSCGATCGSPFQQTRTKLVCSSTDTGCSINLGGLPTQTCTARCTYWTPSGSCSTTCGSGLIPEVLTTSDTCPSGLTCGTAPSGTTVTGSRNILPCTNNPPCEACIWTSWLSMSSPETTLGDFEGDRNCRSLSTGIYTLTKGINCREVGTHKTVPELVSARQAAGETWYFTDITSSGTKQWDCTNDATNPSDIDDPNKNSNVEWRLHCKNSAHKCPNFETQLKCCENK